MQIKGGNEKLNPEDEKLSKKLGSVRTWGHRWNKTWLNLMSVEQLFWKNMAEYGGLDCVDLTFHGKNYQVVSDSQTKSYLLYETDRKEGDDLMLMEFPSLENMLDDPCIDGVSIRQILQQIEVKDYFWH